MTARLKTVTMTDAMSSDPTSPSFRSALTLPLLLLVAGVLLIVASFLPLGNFAAQSQWTSQDAAEFDRLGNEYKKITYQSPARMGLSEAEWEAQRKRIRQQIDAFQQRLDQAKAQPARWSRFLLGAGVLLSVAGAVVQAARSNS